MATLTAGYTFGATETVTNAKLASLVNSGSVTGITQADLASGEGTVKVSTSSPSDTDQLWVDTNSTPVTLRYYNSTLSEWVPAGELALYTNRSGQTGALGRVLILDTTNSNSYTYTSTAADTKFLGIETGSISNTSKAPVVTRGACIVNLEHSASAGVYLRTSTATGKAEPCVSSNPGVFGFLTESGTASARANIFGITPGASADQSANYTWTGTHSFTNTITINTASGTTVNWTPIVQVVMNQVSTSATGSTDVPDDDTPPTSSEGDEYITQAITPKHANNILYIEATFNYTQAATVGSVVAFICQDATANSLCAAWNTPDVGTASLPAQITLQFKMTAGTTSATTFKLRAGAFSSGGVITMNGGATARKFGGVLYSSLKITEVKS